MFVSQISEHDSKKETCFNDLRVFVLITQCDQVGRRRRWRGRSGHIDPDVISSGNSGRRINVDVDFVFRSVGVEDDRPGAECGNSKRYFFLLILK